MYFAESLPTFQSIRSVWMDETLCHRDHTRNDRPAVPLGIDGIAEQMRARPDNAEWGLVSHLSECPEAALLNSSIFSWGYNPEQPFLLRDHHPLFQELFPVVIQAPFDKEYHLDFAGTKTKYEYDCTNWFRYRRYHLSRRIVCDRMDVFSAYGLGTNFAHIPVYGDLPVIDEEYFEWLSLLKALQAWRTESRPFVIAEFGARYGTWAARGAVMARRIHPDLGAHVCAIEGDSVGFAWLQDHMRVNGLYENATLVRGMVGNANDTQIAVQWEPGSTPDAVPVYVVQDLLKTYPVVDIVHIDIQGAETALLDKDVRMFLKKQVRFLHIGTHGNQILHDLKAAYVHDDGWMLLHEFQQGTKILTEMGPITLNADGELAIRNINLVA